jgi:SAM-dependent methyltransferase
MIRSENAMNVAFASFEAWRGWHQEHPWVFDSALVTETVGDIARAGLRDPVSGHVPASEVIITGDNWRETIVALGLNSRTRALMALAQEAAGDHAHLLDVYACECVTSLAERLRAQFPGFVGSEYFSDGRVSQAVSARFPDCTHQDVQTLSFPDSSFDLYVSSEVLEHVPSVSLTIKEARRILRPGGVFLATFPFRLVHYESLTRAVLNTDGDIEYLTEPEYHGNPVNPSGGSLVFTIPGWDILDTCREAGFKQASMRLVFSPELGIVGTHCAGIFVLEARF